MLAVMIKLVGIEIGRKWQRMIGSSNPSDSSDGIDGTLAERENHVLLHVLVFADSRIKVTQSFFSAPLTFAAPYSFRSSKENATQGSGHCNITMIGGGCDPNSILLLSAGGTHSGFGLHLHAICNRSWQRIRNRPC